MSKRTRAAVLGAMLAAMSLAGMTTVAQAQVKNPPASTQDARQPPTERQVGESWRQRQIDHRAATGQAQEPSQSPSVQFPRRHFQPESPMNTEHQLDSGQLTPAPAPRAPAGEQEGLAIAVAVVALLLALGVATTWQTHRRRPRPEPTT